jgi:IclR family KDG regulon transcriptional repressor
MGDPGHSDCHFELWSSLSHPAMPTSEIARCRPDGRVRSLLFATRAPKCPPSAGPFRSGTPACLSLPLTDIADHANLAYVKPRFPTNSFERALMFLEFIAIQKDGLTNTDLARHFQIATSTCSYILSRLESHGYLQRDQATGRYQIGTKVVVLARSAPRQDSGPCPMLHPALQTVVSETRLTAAIGLLRRGRVVLVDEVASNVAMKLKIVLQGVGANLNFDSTAVSKALIAWMPRAELSDLIEQYGLSNTASGVEVSQPKLFQELETVRKCGYATSTWTRVRALAAPIWDTRGVVCAGLTVAGSQTQVAWKHLDTLIALVLGAAQQISHLSVDWSQF